MAHSLGLHDQGRIRIIYPKLHLMRAPWTRAVGLIGRKQVRAGSAYIFRRCPSVHTCFMSIPIDVIICDKHMRVLHVETMQPWRTSSTKVKGRRHIIEAAAGSAAAAGIVPGKSLCLIKGLE